MKPIKFKGFNKKNNKWLYGSYIHNVKGDFIAPDGIFSDEFTWEDFLVEPESVKQLLMVLPDNTEVYEDDTIKIKGVDFIYNVRYSGAGISNEDPNTIIVITEKLKNHITKI